MWQVIFEPEARREFDNAIDWYEEQRPGLGDKFKLEVGSLWQRIAQNPQRFQLAARTIRKARLKTFSIYTVYFRVEREVIGVVAVFSARRDPAELVRRLR